MTDGAETVTHNAVTEQGAVLATRADHAMGLELQIVELVEQQTRAVMQHRYRDAEQLEGELDVLRAELALTADIVAAPGVQVRSDLAEPADLLVHSDA